MLHTERVIRADRLFELLDASGLLTADVKSALLSEYDGKVFDMKASARLFVAALAGMVQDREAIETQFSSIDKATDQIVCELCRSGATVYESFENWIEWEHPGRGSVTRYALAPHAACLRLIVLNSFEIAEAEPEAAQ